jgi:hypothetical protein
MTQDLLHSENIDAGLDQASRERVALVVKAKPMKASILTSFEVGFSIVREGRLGFRSEIESVPGIVRKSKSRSLK